LLVQIPKIQRQLGRSMRQAFKSFVNRCAVVSAHAPGKS
jgi:hypothetical protein